MDSTTDVSQTTTAAESAARLQALREALSSVIRGKEDVIEDIIIALVAGGSILLEDVPGVGKTTLAKTLAAALDLKFQRVQCTPDLLPADIFGFSVFNPQDGTFSFRPGPVFCNVLLVDEINRASPRTQSALLEAMAERQVTIEGTRYDLEPPFLVIATQNPLGFQGTYPLPEAQLDRFLLQVTMDYPGAEQEVEILYDQMQTHPIENVRAVLGRNDVVQFQSSVRGVRVDRSVADYIVEIVRRTREHERLRLGGSPRGSLMMFRASQACAFVRGRDYVLPDDVQQVAALVLPHRVVTTASSGVNKAAAGEVVRQILREVDVPV